MRFDVIDAKRVAKVIHCSRIVEFHGLLQHFGEGTTMNLGDASGERQQQTSLAIVSLDTN